MAQVVYTSLTDGNGAQGTLFKGHKFWLSRKVPQRSRFIAEIQANGGEVFPSEKQADLLIVDHARKEALPGTYSYRFIEKSIRNGTLERLSDHAVGPPLGTIRAVGSLTQPAKTRRQKFTEEDDRILLNWVQSSLRKGARTEGNEIYKQLQVKHPQHPWQSWRDRWVKYLRDTCPIAMSDEDSLHSPSDHLEGSEAPKKNDAPAGTKAETRIEFSEEDMKILLENGEHICKIPPENVASAWKAWAHEIDEQRRTAQQWQDFWEKSVLPIHLKRASSSRKSSMDSGSDKISSLQKQISIPPSAESPVFSKMVVSRQTQSPEIPLANESSSPDSRSNDVSKAAAVEEPKNDPSETPEIFYPAVEIPTDANLSPKRKRAASEEDFPSSSPPYLEPSTKKQRRQEGSMPAEIAQTPEQSPIHNRDFSSSAFKSLNPKHSMGSRYEGNIDEDGHRHDEAKENEEEKEHLTLHGNESEPDDEDSVQEDEKIFGRQASPVLSEANREIVETQTLRNESTPFIDFDVAPPEDGWDESLAGSSKSSPSLPSLTYQAPVHRNSKSKQIADIEGTQQVLPDFFIPAPDGGWDTFESLPSSHNPNSPTPSSPTQSEIPDLLDAWIDEHVASGFSSIDVISALEHSSLDKELAETVLGYMKGNRGGIPTDMAGVWTESDDEGLQSTDVQRYRKVEVKHGSENIEKRWNFLNECNECKRAAAEAG